MSGPAKTLSGPDMKFTDSPMGRASVHIWFSVQLTLV